MGKGIKVNSEIGRLKRVLVHRPGEEVENLSPATFERLLFDDSMYLKVAREEHDAFAKVLTDAGVEVIYVEELTAETLDLDKKIKDEFISQFIDEAGVYRKEIKEALTTYLNSFKTTKEMVDKTIAGIY
jgi:arginine deiminase